VAGLQTILRARDLGAEPIIHERFDAHAVGAATEARWVSLVPTQLVRLLDEGIGLGHLDGILLGGAPPMPGLLDRAAAAGLRVVTSYGMTETCGGCVYDGTPFDRVEVDVRDDGRIRLRGPVVMRGYRGDPVLSEQVLRAGWYLTSDVGRKDADGRLEVLGRVDDVIITGGENVSARAVGDVLRSHPAVADVHVLGSPHPRWGQQVTALVVATDARLPPTLRELRAHASSHLPNHALPREVRVVAGLQRDPMGKVRRDVVARLLAD